MSTINTVAEVQKCLNSISDSLEFHPGLRDRIISAVESAKNVTGTIFPGRVVDGPPVDGSLTFGIYAIVHADGSAVVTGSKVVCVRKAKNQYDRGVWKWADESVVLATSPSGM